MKSDKRVVSTLDAPAAIGPYSQAMKTGSLIFLSGQIALDPASGALVEGGVRDQTERVLRNIGAILNSQGLGYRDVVKTTVFLRDISKFAEFNEAYGSYFQSEPPARTTVEASNLPKGALVEIEAIAALDTGTG